MTKTTSLALLSMLAAFAVQACAAPASDDVSSDPVTAPSEEASSEETPKANDALGGKFGERPAAMSAGIAGSADGEMRVDANTYGQLVLVDRKQTYDLQSYGFAVGSNFSMDGTGREIAGQPTLSDVNLVVQRTAGMPSLSKDVFSAAPIGRAVIRQRDAYGKFVDVAELDGVMVASVLAAATYDYPVESVTLRTTAVTIKSGKASVTIDLRLGQTTCSVSPCPCDTTAGQLGPYVQAASSAMPIEKGAKRVDALAVSVSNVVGGAFGGATSFETDKVLDFIHVTSGFETSGMCAAYHAAKASMIPSVHLGVAAPSSYEPRESTSWDACAARVKSVSFSSRYDMMGQDIELDAAGLVRTDREWTDKEIKSTTFGWSFVKHQPISSCSATF